MSACNPTGSKSCSRQSNFKGFTLLELMVTVAILAILLAIGVPSFQSFIQSSHHNSSIEGTTSALHLARSEAVTRSTNVTLCRRNSSGSACENGSNWNNGWLIITGGRVLRAWDPPSGGTAVTIGGGGNSITFGSDGSISNDATYSFSISGAGSTCTLSVSRIGTLSSTNC